MQIAKREFVLNYAMNRWQLNFKRNVGPTSDSIRLLACGSPFSILSICKAALRHSYLQVTKLPSKEYVLM